MCTKQSYEHKIRQLSFEQNHVTPGTNTLVDRAGFAAGKLKNQSMTIDGELTNRSGSTKTKSSIAFANGVIEVGYSNWRNQPTEPHREYQYVYLPLHW